MTLEGFANCVKFFGPFPRGLEGQGEGEGEREREGGRLRDKQTVVLIFFTDEKCGEIFIDRVTNLLFQVTHTHIPPTHPPTHHIHPSTHPHNHTNARFGG